VHLSSPEVIGSIILLVMAVSYQYAMAYTMEPERYSLRSWFVRMSREPRDPKKSKELKQLLMNLAFAIFFGVGPFPVFWKWLGWFFCFSAFVYILQSAIDPIHEFPAKTRLCDVGGGFRCGILVNG
jgi:hypothetical protein